jgi:large subunit ribosomal protein L24
MRVKKGDKVQVVAGKDRVLGPAKILRVLPDADKVVVEGRNLVTKHKKGNQMLGTESRIEQVEAPIHVSNVMLWSDKAGKPVRTQARYVGANDELFASRQSAKASFAEPPKVIRKVRVYARGGEVVEIFD